MLQAYFETLNEALGAENLINRWQAGLNIEYGETVQMETQEENLADRILISVYRNNEGRYERPIYYGLYQ